MKRSIARRSALEILFVTMLIVGLSGPAAPGHIDRCFGRIPDINRSHDPSGSFLVGTPETDVIIGSPDADHIEGRGGVDFICAGEGEDEVFGGVGDDRLAGGPDRDLLDGGWGSDLLRGGLAADVGHGRRGFDRCLSVEQHTSCEDLT